MPDVFSPDRVAAADLRHAMGRLATGVTVVTSVSRTGEPAGTTASSVTSVSLDPPLLLVCFPRTSLTLAAIQNHGAFAVNVLGERHHALSSAFARGGSADVWELISHAPGRTGSPLLRGALSTFDCSVERLYPGGDHVIVVGRVDDVAVAADETHAPLLFYRGGYAAIAG